MNILYINKLSKIKLLSFNSI